MCICHLQGDSEGRELDEALQPRPISALAVTSVLEEQQVALLAWLRLSSQLPPTS
jgi:hypothetical protein